MGQAQQATQQPQQHMLVMQGGVPVLLSATVLPMQVGSAAAIPTLPSSTAIALPGSIPTAVTTQAPPHEGEVQGVQMQPQQLAEQLVSFLQQQAAQPQQAAQQGQAPIALLQHAQQAQQLLVMQQPPQPPQLQQGLPPSEVHMAVPQQAACAGAELPSGASEMTVATAAPPPPQLLQPMQPGQPVQHVQVQPAMASQLQQVPQPAQLLLLPQTQQLRHALPAQPQQLVQVSQAQELPSQSLLPGTVPAIAYAAPAAPAVADYGGEPVAAMPSLLPIASSEVDTSATATAAPLWAPFEQSVQQHELPIAGATIAVTPFTADAPVKTQVDDA